MAKKKTSEEEPKIGRPAKLDNEEIRAKLLAMSLLDTTVEMMCKHAGVSETAYYEYIKKHPEFLEEIDENRSMPYKTAVETVNKAIATDPKIALAYLERKHKDEYSPRRELTGANGAGLFEGASDDDLRKLIES